MKIRITRGNRILWFTMLFCLMAFRSAVFMYNQTLRYYFNIAQVIFFGSIFIVGIENIIRKGEISYNLVYIFLWQIITIITTVAHNLPVENVLLQALIVCSIFLFIGSLRENVITDVMAGIRNFFFINCFLDVFFILTTGRNGLFPEMIPFTGTPIYFTNGKFATSYLQLFFSGFFVINLEKRHMRAPFVRYILYCVIMCINIWVTQSVRCTTGTIVNLIFWAFVLIPATKKLIDAPWKIAVTVFVMNLAIVIFQVTLNMPVVQLIISQMFDKQLTLTGRTNIYSAYGQIMENHWLIGAGYGNSVVLDVIGHNNAQNAFFESLLTCGLIGTVFLVRLIIRAIQKTYRDQQRTSSQVLIYMVFAFFVAGVVEISFGVWFYLLIALMLRSDHASISESDSR